MFHHSRLEQIQKRWKLLAFFAILGAVIGVLLLLFAPMSKYYRSDAEVLIIAETRYAADSYSAYKSAERVGENLAQIMKTSDFSRKVLTNIGQSIDLSEYSNVTERDRRKAWSKNIEASVGFGTGILSVSVYHESERDAAVLHQAILNTLLLDSAEYTGENVSLKVVNQPVVSEYPVRPSIPYVIAFGAVVGLLLGMLLFVKK